MNKAATYNRPHFGERYLPLLQEHLHKDRIQRSHDMLSKVLMQGNTVAVIGAGLSRPLGYPLWKEFAEQVVNKTKDDDKTKNSTEERRLNEFSRALSENDKLDAARLKFYIGYCKSLLSKLSESEYHKTFQSILQRHNQCHNVDFDEKCQENRNKNLGCAANPYDDLMALPIYRFVTTNYDLELEDAIHRKRGVEWEKFGIKWRAPSADDQQGDVAESNKLRFPDMRLSFTQDGEENCEQLALFALSGTDQNRNMVFHCHGRIDKPASTIVSEADYQSWYLTEQNGTRAIFRQTLELLFSSNPLLFIGYGLGDEDLLRPLRILGAQDPKNKDKRPIFVLSPSDYENNDVVAKDRDTHDMYFEQYGVHVIPMRRVDSPESWGRAYQKMFRGIKSQMEQRQWTRLQKPFFRKVKVNAKENHHYRPIELSPPAALETMQLSPPAKRNIRWIVDKISQEEPPRFLVLDGPPGSGKSYHARHIIKGLREREVKLDGSFYWDFYLSDDGQAAIERLISFLQGRSTDRENAPREEVSGPCGQRLRRLLYDKRYLIIFDGCDRLLLEKEAKRGEGSSYSVGFRNLISSLVDNELKTNSTIVLVTRLFPIELSKFDESTQPKLCRISLTYMTTENLKVGTFFSEWDDNKRSELVALLGGHIESVKFAALYIYGYDYESNKPNNEESKKKINRRWTTLKTELSNCQPKRRLHALIRLMLNDKEANKKYNPYEATKILQIISLFGTSVDIETISTCYGSEQDKERNGFLKYMLKELKNRTLVYKWKEQGVKYYATPQAIRHYVFQDEHGEKSYLLPSFGIAGSTSLKPGVQPESQESARLLETYFDRLYDRALESRQERSQEGSRRAQKFARRLFSLMRSRMDARLAAVWCDYDKYTSFGLRMLHLSLATAAKQTWAYRDAQEVNSIHDEQGIFHARELSWLYNDLGMALRAAGETWDAYTIWEQGYQINQVMTKSQMSFSSHDDYELQSLLNFCIYSIDVGRLPDAVYYLQEAERANQTIQDPDFKSRILGYNGLLAHLQGHLKDANRLYQKAIKTTNHRARAIFQLHQADLKIEVDDLSSATHLLRDSQALAEANHQRDLLLRIKIAQGKLLTRQEDFVTARKEIDAVLKQVKRMRLRLAEVDAGVAMSRIALRQGDAEGSRRWAMHSLTLANRHNLGLGQTKALVALGRSTVEIGQRELGIAYLKHAANLAANQGYWLRTREIQQHLQALGEGREMP